MDEVQVFLGLSSFLDNIRVPLVSTRVLTRVVWLFFFPNVFVTLYRKFFGHSFRIGALRFPFVAWMLFFFFPWDWGV